MRLNRWIYWALVLALLGLILFRPVLGVWFKHLLDGDSEGQREDSLIFENQNLKAEIAKLKEIDARTPENYAEDYDYGFVYARYPFNIKNQVLINVGKDVGVTMGKTVLFGAYSEDEIGRSVLFGSIKNVFEATSLVETIFSNEWRSEVRIGDKQVLGVLEGGATPAVRLINKDANILEGDVVYSADERFPYGLAIGYIKDIEMSSDHLFKEAKLDIPYDLAQVGLVLVLK
ncbi:MAG: rod shape-determining protein MreC [Patescibacteria group bacterium]